MLRRVSGCTAGGCVVVVEAGSQGKVSAASLGHFCVTDLEFVGKTADLPAVEGHYTVGTSAEIC